MIEFLFLGKLTIDKEGLSLSFAPLFCFFLLPKYSWPLAVYRLVTLALFTLVSVQSRGGTGCFAVLMSGWRKRESVRALSELGACCKRY